MVACADYFQDKADAAGATRHPPEAMRRPAASMGTDACRMGVDAVAIQSPPFFHLMQAADAVAAGKHVHLAKPAAVDVPGRLSIAARMPGYRQPTGVPGRFPDTRPAAYIEAVNAHAGAIGKLVSVASPLTTQPLYFQGTDDEHRKNIGNPEGARPRLGRRLRAQRRRHHRAEISIPSTFVIRSSMRPRSAPSALAAGAPVRRRLPWASLRGGVLVPNDVLISFSSK